MLGEVQALVMEVRPWDAHGSAFLDVTVAYPDRSVASARIGRESAPRDLEPGDRVIVRLVMNTIVEIRRDGPAGGEPVGGEPVDGEPLGGEPPA